MRILIIIFIFIAAISCQSSEKPKGVLSETQLSELLVDVYLAEAKVDAIPKVKDSTIRYFIPFERKLLKKKGISDSVLKITYSYYLSHPKELERIYDSVIDTLILREQRSNITPSGSNKKVKPVPKDVF